MDKDQVLIDRLKAERDKNRSNTKDGPRSEHGELLWLTPLGRLLNDAAAELESLRAMRKRVEGKVDGWEKNGTEDAKFCASQIRAALGDSHE